MFLLIRLLFTGVALFVFLTFFLTDYEDRRNSISYKLYLFTFMFLLQVTLNIFSNIFNREKISVNSIIDTAINNALLSVIAYDVYNDLVFNDFYKTCNKLQKTSILVVLVLSFITAVKLLQLLLTQ